MWTLNCSNARRATFTIRSGDSFKPGSSRNSTHPSTNASSNASASASARRGYLVCAASCQTNGGVRPMRFKDMGVDQKDVW